jgi:20S proteasome alpha/beta subunit
MSLGIIIKGPEGLVLATESRVTITSRSNEGTRTHVNFDNATKLLSFSPPNNAVGTVTYGQAAIGLRTAQSFLPEFEAELPEQRLSVQAFAQRLSDFFLRQWQAVMHPDYKGLDMTFVVGGFNQGEPYGRVFLFDIPRKPTPQEQNARPGEFGITWGGQREFVDRLIQGYDYRLPDTVTKALDLNDDQSQELRQAIGKLQMQIPLIAMPLQDCVDLAIFFIRTTIIGQRLTVGMQGCGGPIDVATITRREGLRFIQHKQIVGERP